MKMFKKNQVVIYVIALMLVVAGYLNYTTTNDLNTTIQTSSTEEELAKMANIGDAQLVSSNVLNENNNFDENIVTSSDIMDNNIVSSNDVVDNNNENIKDNKVENNTVYTSSSSSKNDVDYFSTSRLERDTMYSQMLETYEKVLNSNNSLETQKQSASNEITKINNIKNSIMICENLIKIKGFDDVVVFANGESINVIVKDEQLSAEKVAQIQNIISREMNAKVENIHITNK